MNYDPAQELGLRHFRLYALFVLLAALLLFIGSPAVGMEPGFGTDPTVSFSSEAQVVTESSGGAAITEGELPLVAPVGMAVFPVYQRIPLKSKTFLSPVDVTIDRDGRMYVVDSYAGTVFRLSPGGMAIDSLAGLDSPICAAVDAAGRIYVGNLGGGSVKVYDPDFNLLFSLGSGDGEFGHPGDIAIDSSGTLYVVDAKSNSVSRWDQNGNFIDYLGERGDGNGQFHLPLSVAIDEIDQKIFVLDRSNGARVQSFDMAGMYLGSLYLYGTTIGGLIRPQHITVDGEHRLYISDSAQNVVLVYDTGGTYLGAVYDLDSPVRSPLGLAVSSTNMLYVASRAAKKVEVYGLDEYVSMAVSPRALSFTATAGGAVPASQTLTIGNTGTTVVTVQTGVNGDWLSLAGETAELSPGLATTVEVAVSTAELTPGTYSGSISVSAGTAAAEVVQVTLTVLPAVEPVPAARLSVSPGILSFASEVGVLPHPRTISIANTGDAPLYWEIFSDKEWMSVSRASGTVAVGETMQDVIVLADSATLTAGTYTGYVVVYAPGAHDNTAMIDVSFTLTEPLPGPSPTPPPGTSWIGKDRRTWTVVAQTNGTALNSIWGTSAELFAVGDSGTILHYDGSVWNEDILPTTLNVNGVWGTSASSVYAVGESGLLLHYDGDGWSDISASFAGTLQDIWCSENFGCATVGQDSTILSSAAGDMSWLEESSLENSGSLRSVWGISDSDLYVVGDFGVILHYSGGEWLSVDASTVENLTAVWGSAADDVYVVGEGGIILHFNGTAWRRMESGTTVRLSGIWGNGAAEIYAVGEAGTMLLYTGSKWDSLDVGIAEDLRDAWAVQQKEIYAVGADGSIIFGRSSSPWRLFIPAILSHKRQAPSQGAASR